ncbi:mediator complex, subunit Med7 [Biscogniauxia marginata]|nr:mediator complex, subunit Med7 [Biscogniauxia marginata]
MEEEQPQVSSTWPPPPPFWQAFTPENVARIDDLRREKAEQEGLSEEDASAQSATVRLEGLPRELRNLQPPPEPAGGEWRVFGDKYQLVDELPRLEDMQIRRLFPNPEERDQDGKHFDRATILKRLAKSLLLNFLELTGLLATNPSAAEEKITDLRDLFINFHHLINEYRPHQARESLISMMQAQLDRTRAETNAIRDAKDKAERILEGLGSLKIEDLAGVAASEAKNPWAEAREMWATLLDDFP